MRIASYNVHKCVGGDGRFDPARIAGVIAEIGADLVAVQEADRRHGVRLGLLDEAALARDAGLVVLPVSHVPGGQGWRGNALLVRPGTRVLRGPLRLRLPGVEPRGALMATLDLGSGPVNVVAAHLGLLRGCRAGQAAALLAALEGFDRGLPTVLMGDLNEWKRRSSPLATLATYFGSPASPRSFPARKPLLRLDRILARPSDCLGPVEAHDTPLARIASDHLPLKAELRLQPAVAAPAPAEGLPALPAT